jgi:hypothetical protein
MNIPHIILKSEIKLWLNKKLILNLSKMEPGLNRNLLQWNNDWNLIKITPKGYMSLKWKQKGKTRIYNRKLPIFCSYLSDSNKYPTEDDTMASKHVVSN